MVAPLTRAGELRDRFRFEQRAVDDNGDRLGEWGADAVTVWTQVTPLKGGEAVQEARLQGTQPFVLTIRAWSATKVINTGWRAVDINNPARVMTITGATLTLGRAWMEILATQKQGQTNG